VRRSNLAAVAALALALAACSSPAGAPTGATTPTKAPGATTAAVVPTTPPAGATAEAPAAVAARLCAMLTPDDLKTATGTVFGAGVADDYGQCIWHAGTATVNDGKGQLVLAMQDITLATAKGMFGTGGTDLTVGGHAALWNVVENVGGTIWVDAGSRVLVMTFNPNEDDTQAALTQLAGIAAAKL